MSFGALTFSSGIPRSLMTVLKAFMSNNAAALKSLTSLYISVGNTKITDDGVTKLFVPLPNLSHLYLNFTNVPITDKAIEDLANNALAKMKTLQSLTVSLPGTELTDKGAFHLFSNIYNPSRLALQLGNTKINNKTLETLGKIKLPIMKALEDFEIGLSDTAVTDDGIINVVNSLKNLKRLCLRLDYGKITDRCLQVLGSNVLAPMKDLEEFYIGLGMTGVTDEGVLQVVSSLQNVKKLTIDLEFTGVTDKSWMGFYKGISPRMKEIRGLDVNMKDTQASEKTLAEIEDVKSQIIAMNK